MNGPLSDGDIRFLRGVVNDPGGSGRSVPTGRAVTAGRLDRQRIELHVRSDGPHDPAPAQIAAQVLEPGWSEVACGWPDERVFRGIVAE